MDEVSFRCSLKLIGTSLDADVFRMFRSSMAWSDCESAADRELAGDADGSAGTGSMRTDGAKITEDKLFINLHQFITAILIILMI